MVWQTKKNYLISWFWVLEYDKWIFMVFVSSVLLSFCHIFWNMYKTQTLKPSLEINIPKNWNRWIEHLQKWTHSESFMQNFRNESNGLWWNQRSDSRLVWFFHTIHTERKKDNSAGVIALSIVKKNRRSR